MAIHGMSKTEKAAAFDLLWQGHVSPARIMNRDWPELIEMEFSHMLRELVVRSCYEAIAAVLDTGKARKNGKRKPKSQTV